jgi:hypothetical protein
MRQSLFSILILAILLGACTPTVAPQSQAVLPSTMAEKTLPEKPSPIATLTHSIPTLSPSIPPSTVPPSATATSPAQPTSTTAASPGEAIIINHDSIALFDKIPEQYLKAAASIHLLFRHASVGYNITEGLDCLMDTVQPRPFFCDAGIPPQEVLHDSKYDRTNWVFEFHAPPPGQNPGWWDKLNLFVDRVDNPAPGENFDAYSFKFGYVDAITGSAIDDEFFLKQPGGAYPHISALEELEKRHPDKKFIYWTIALARIVGTPDSQSFNQQMRDYATTNGKILMDIADIESHTPDGQPCYTTPDSGIEIICSDYTTEREGGHLNALGSLRMSKAVWVLMARIAGWDGK